MREKRQALGLSQEKLARLLDVSYGTIANWENGKSAPSVEHSKALSDALDWPLLEMLGV
jgi:transcriptional regulator with XRE-family HTH domain